MTSKVFARRHFFLFLVRLLAVRLALLAARPTDFFALARGRAVFEAAARFFVVLADASFPRFNLVFGAAFFVRAAELERGLALAVLDALFFAFLLRETSRT